MESFLKKIDNFQWRCIYNSTKHWSSLFPQALVINAATSNLKNGVGKNFSLAMLSCKNGELGFYFPDKEWIKIGQEILNRIIDDKNFVIKVNNHIKKYCQLLVNHALRASQSELSKIDNRELFNLYKNYCLIDKKMRDFAWVASIVDFDSNLLTKYLYNILREKMGNDDLVGPAFSVLTNPKGLSFSEKERQSQQKIISTIRNNIKYKNLFREPTLKILSKLKEYPNLLKFIRRHYVKFAWLSVVFENDHLTLEDFVQMIKKNLYSGENTKTTIIRPIVLKLNKTEKRLFKDASRLLFYKAYRKDMQGMSHYYFRPVLEEIGKRMGLDLKMTRYLLPSEVYDGLVRRKKISFQSLRDRYNFSIILSSRGQSVAIIGSQAKKINEIIKKNNITLGQTLPAENITGQTAYPGMAKGKVRIANNKNEIKNIKKGEVIVSIQTNPDMIAGLRKCVGLITDNGGITCHAAIVARELKIPCVVGTKMATKILKNGDLVEINANKGIIKKLNI